MTALLRERLERGGLVDSLAVQVLTLQRPMPEGLQAALRRMRAGSDSVATARLYRALLYWQPFNEPLLRDAVAFVLDAPALDAWTGQLALYAAQRTGDVQYYNALAASLLRRDHLAAARQALDAVEARDADEPVMLYNKARLLILQGDTLGARGYFDRYRAASATQQP